MRIEEMAGKAGTKQASVGGFETEDVLYLLPIVTLTSGVMPFRRRASIGAPLFAAWVVIDYWRVRAVRSPAARTGANQSNMGQSMSTQAEGNVIARRRCRFAAVAPAPPRMPTSP